MSDMPPFWMCIVNRATVSNHPAVNLMSLLEARGLSESTQLSPIPLSRHRQSRRRTLLAEDQ
jgi:hypothetical protein